MIKIEIPRNLFLTSLVVRIPPPYFELYNILMSKVIDDNIGTGLIASLRFNIIIANAIDDGL